MAALGKLRLSENMCNQRLVPAIRDAHPSNHERTRKLHKPQGWHAPGQMSATLRHPATPWFMPDLIRVRIYASCRD